MADWWLNGEGFDWWLVHPANDWWEETDSDEVGPITSGLSVDSTAVTVDSILFTADNRAS